MKLVVPLVVMVHGLALLSLATAWQFIDERMDATFTESAHYQTTISDRFPGYHIRVKQSETCEDAIQYSGYVDNIGRDDHTFFWFVTSRRSPKTDPTVLWLNGGPGSSSMIGAWMELGPCLVNEHGNDTFVNPYSWNNAANVLFLDQPFNVGYSYGRSTIRSSAEAARNMFAVLQIFFEKFSEYRSTSFHIAGESFGGHYVPALSDEIIQRNMNLPPEERLPRLDSLLIGNGWVDPKTQLDHYASFGCTVDNRYKPLFNAAECQAMKNALRLCQKLMSICYSWQSAAACLPAGFYCQETQVSPLSKTGLSPFDIRKNCTGDNSYCDEQVNAVEHWANQAHVREQLGVDIGAGKFVSDNDIVARRFALEGDLTRNYSPSITRALDNGVRVLVYAGDMDWTCNWYGNKAWTMALDWEGKPGYQDTKGEEWYNSDTGEHAGQVHTHLNFTFLRVFDAGHLVPYDQPANTLDFFSKWIRRIPLQ